MISILVFLVLAGLVVWLVDRFIPMAEPFKTLFRVAIVILFCVYILNLIGISIPGIHR